MRWIFFLFFFLWALPVVAIGEIADQTPQTAQIINDEGGTVTITGEVAYTSPLFTLGVAEPLIILEDQTGFVRRDKGYVFPVESQVLGQITSDFFTSPFTYNLTLPIEPTAPLNDVDNDDDDDRGVMIYAIAYWSNAFGDAYVGQRDQFGGGWSTAYASTVTSSVAEMRGEYTGGTLLIYAPDGQQGFPAGFGEDGLLFTEDDPIATVPQGYSIVDMNAEPFTLDRSRDATVDLIEGEGVAVDDFSDMDIVPAFDAMLEKFRREYAFTEYKNINWDALSAEYRPRMENAQNTQDAFSYYAVLRDFLWEIPDGHVSSNLLNVLFNRFVTETDGGIGMAIRELDDGRVIVNYVLEGSPADEAGIELRAEILGINDLTIENAIAQTVPWSSPFSTDHVRRLQQLRYLTRFLVDETVTVRYRNPGDSTPQTAELVTVAELDSFNFSSFNRGETGYELPVQYRPLPEEYLLVEITSFSDDERLTVQLWERMIRDAKENNAPGIIIDMRNNGGGSGFLADQMAAYFFDEPLVVGNKALYDETLDAFYVDPDTQEVYYLPPEELRYGGPVAVLVGPDCSSACEFFSYNMSLQDRAAIVGQYPTGGLGGSIEQFYMPGGVTVQFTTGRSLDAEGNIHIEGIGVVPTVRVPVTEETLFYEGDAVLDAAVAHLQAQ